MAVPVYDRSGAKNWGDIGWNPGLESYGRRSYFYGNPEAGRGDQGLYGQEDVNRQNVFNSIADALGRIPSEDEYANLLPIWRQDADLGRQAVSNYKKTSPDYLKAKAGEYSGDVGGVFQSLLNRGATQAELQHFGQLMATGEVDPYEIEQFVKSGTEYQTKQDTAFRSGLNTELQAAEAPETARQRENILSRYASMGRTGSSALDFAITDMLGKVAEKRQGFLANLSASQYGSNKATARSDYETSLGDYMKNWEAEKSKGPSYLNRAWNIGDYNRQSQDYANWVNSQKRKSGLGGGIGSLVGAGVGALGAGLVTGGMGAPAGAALGASLGGGGGGLYDYFN
jgi:hypothetical protein